MNKLTLVYNEGRSYITFNDHKELCKWADKKWPGCSILPFDYAPARGPYEVWIGNEKVAETETQK